MMEGMHNLRWQAATLSLLIMASVLMSACGSTESATGEAENTGANAVPSVTPIPTTEALPDLLVASGEMSVQGLSNGCVQEPNPLTTSVCVQNAGDGEAGPFTVRVLHRVGGTSFDWRVEELAAGEELCLDDEGPPVGRAMVDADDEVTETDEFNNNLIVSLPPPTVVCTVAPTPTITPTPGPLPPPTATPFPEGSKVTTEVFPVYDCRYLGQGIYEWYRVEVTYVDGVPVEERIIRGPLMGEYVGGCPANPAEPEPEKQDSSEDGE